MLFDEADLSSGQTALVHGAAGSVGRYAVMLARNAGIRVIATALERNIAEVRALGADDAVLPADLGRYAGAADAAIDLVGGPSQMELFPCLKTGGSLISAVAAPSEEEAARRGVRAKFMLVHVESRYLDALSERFEEGTLRPLVGGVLPLSEAKLAHEMLEGIRPSPRGKIVFDLSRTA